MPGGGRGGAQAQRGQPAREARGVAARGPTARLRIEGVEIRMNQVPVNIVRAEGAHRGRFEVERVVTTRGRGRRTRHGDKDTPRKGRMSGAQPYVRALL